MLDVSLFQAFFILCHSKLTLGPFIHYGIACLNHIIDIVSVSEPVIKEIEVNESIKTQLE
jgi:hypothetical protein